MAKKFALVSPLYSFAVQDIMDKIIEQAEGEDIELIQSTPGGSVFSAWALAGFFKDREGKLTIKAFGDCSSMGFFNCLYADRVEALDVTQFTIHRADGWADTDDERKRLDTINKDLRKAMENKLDQPKFEKITGKTFDEIFNPKERLDVTITAKQAKQIGLVDRVIKMNDSQVNALNEKFVAFSDFFTEPQGNDSTQGGEKNPVPKAKVQNNNNQNFKQMTIQEIQSQHPEAYNAIMALGVNQEKDRAGSYMAYIGIDPEAVAKGINSGDAMTETFRSNMNVKQISALKLEGIKEETTEGATEATTTVPKAEAPKTPEALAKETFDAKVMEEMNLETKKED